MSQVTTTAMELQGGRKDRSAAYNIPGTAETQIERRTLFPGGTVAPFVRMHDGFCTYAEGARLRRHRIGVSTTGRTSLARKGGEEVGE